MINKIKEIESICKEYNFMDREVRPYNFNIKVRKLIDGWKGYDNCTRSSQHIIEAEVAGFENILREWINYENEPMVSVRIIKGSHRGQERIYHKSTSDMLVEGGLAEYI